MKILDACCGGKMFWYEKDLDFVTFQDVRTGKTSWLNIKYGKLPKDWETFFKNAFSEIFRVLKENGVLIFKWNETQLKFGEVIKHSPYKPMLGDQRGQTRWTVFVKNTALHHRKGEVYC